MHIYTQNPRGIRARLLPIWVRRSPVRRRLLRRILRRTPRGILGAQLRAAEPKEPLGPLEPLEPLEPLGPLGLERVPTHVVVPCHIHVFHFLSL